MKKKKKRRKMKTLAEQKKRRKMRKMRKRTFGEIQLFKMIWEMIFKRYLKDITFIIPKLARLCHSIQIPCIAPTDGMQHTEPNWNDPLDI
jgi:hypothetical protein